MAAKTRIGLFFSYNKEWIAGTYYVLNIIHALKTLSEELQPEIVIISREHENFEIVKKETAYAKLTFCEYPVKLPVYAGWERALNKLAYVLAKKKLIKKRPQKAKVDFVYPYVVENVAEKELLKVNWIPDFQELHLSHLFTEDAISERQRHQKQIAYHSDWLVVSSEDAKNDFFSMYPAATTNVFVLPFAVTHPSIDHLEMASISKKYTLPATYYFSPNQFWAHKNHKVVLEALVVLKERGVIIHVAFSGNENDPRNVDYVTELKQFIEEHQIADQLSFLGFMPRDEQLKVMQEARAVLQPSMFEGWSTVVEDAKALGQFIIVSNLNVHQEQLSENASFFDPKDAAMLAVQLETYWKEPPVKKPLDYTTHRTVFAKNFMELVAQAKR